MSLFAVCSAKGAPGVTTAATAIALTWGGPSVLADLDSAGGDLAIRYRTADGQPLSADRGLVSLGASLRRGIEGDPVSPHVQLAAGALPVLAGVTRPEQMVGLGSSWGNLGYALAAAPNTDVIADCGRVLPGSALLPVLAQAHGLLFVARPTVEELFHLRERLAGLGAQLGDRETRSLAVGVALVTDERDRSSLGEVQRLLDQARIKARVVGHLAYDGKAATRLRYDLFGAGSRSLLLRSAAALGDGMRTLAAQRHHQYA